MKKLSKKQLKEVIQALHAIDPGIDRQEWIRVAASLKISGVNFTEFNEWSKGAANYKNEQDCKLAWESLTEDNINTATLFYIAKQHGYTGKKKDDPEEDYNVQFVEGEHVALIKRGINSETCQKADFRVGKYTGYLTNRETGQQVYVTDEWVQIATWRDPIKGTIISQKIRNDRKWFKFIGKSKGLDLWGINDYTPTENLFITITGGEIDRLSVMQAQGLQYPVVSPPAGEGSAYKAIKKNLQTLMGYKYVVLALDNDKAGQEAMQKCLELFEPNKVKIATWPNKDANEMTQMGLEKEITHVLWNAKNYAPKNLVTVKDIRDRVLKQPQFGRDYPWESMTKATYGFQLGEIHIIVAANGIGKTEFVKDLMFHMMDMGIGLFSFEQDPEDTLRRLVGNRLGIKLHLPGAIWNETDINKELDYLDGKIYLCENAGGMDHDELFRSITYLAKAENKRLFFIDNIRGLGIGHDVELAGSFMRKLQTLCRTLKITIFLLSHVAKDKYTTQVYTSTSPKNKEAYDAQTAEDVEKAVKKPGMDWESGRMPTTVNIDGPSVFGDLANYIWALARNKVSEDAKEASVTRVKALKTRLDGQFTGIIFKLRYTNEGKLEEIGRGIETNFENSDGEAF